MLDSVLRGLPRLVVLLVLSALFLLVSYLPELIGLRGGFMPDLGPTCFKLGWAFMALALGDMALRILQPRIDPQDMAMHARRNNCQASALVYLGRCILAAALLLAMISVARADAPPAAAVPLLPVLKAQQRTYWPDVPLASALGGQVEAETCITLSHPKCWNPRAQLRTSREQGIGLGQLTRAFRADGSTRFDALAEIVAAHPRELAGLSWRNPYDAQLQLRALVLKDRDGFARILATASPLDRLAMALSAYNGGVGGVLADRRACAATPGCDPGRWFGNVERTSLKARAAVAGYGQSFFQINRQYVRNILLVRRLRYLVLDA